MPVLCCACKVGNAILKRPKTAETLCKECFFTIFENEVHETIIENKLFQRDELVAIAASGGKDSTVLAHLMKLLNDRHDYGLKLILLSIDEGITGYRDDSLELKLFVDRLSIGPPIEISGLGFFTMSKDFISTLVGAYVTYYFLLAQFKDTGKSS